MLARQLRHHPAWTADGLAAELAAAVDRLELMRAENLSVTAAFDLSYQDLTPGEQRLFRRLGLHPGPDIDAYAAAALDDTDLAAARRQLDGLYDQYLLTEPLAAAMACTTWSASTPARWPRPATRRTPAPRRAAAGLLRARGCGRRPAHRRPGRRRRWPPPGDPPAGPAADRAEAGVVLAGGRAS